MQTTLPLADREMFAWISETVFIETDGNYITLLRSWIYNHLSTLLGVMSLLGL